MVWHVVQVRHHGQFVCLRVVSVLRPDSHPVLVAVLLGQAHRESHDLLRVTLEHYHFGIGLGSVSIKDALHARQPTDAIETQHCHFYLQVKSLYYSLSSSVVWNNQASKASSATNARPSPRIEAMVYMASKA